MKGKRPTPPSWPLKLLARLCPSGLIEAISGDLLERFEEDHQEFGLAKAKRRFVINTFRFLHPAILLRNKFKMKTFFTSIAASHFKVAFRSILKHRFYSAVNILGLSFSIAFVFLSWLFIQNESFYDHFHENADNIYRVYSYKVAPESGEVIDDSSDGITPVPLGLALKEESPSVSHATRFGSATGTVAINDSPYEELICMADQDFLEMFTFPLIKGHRFNVLKNPNAILLSQEKAEKYFGSNDPIGQELEVTLSDSTKTFVVAGVIDNKKNQSSIEFDILVPFETMRMAASETHMTSYNVSFVESWIMLNQPADKKISEVLTSIINTRTDDNSGDWNIDLQPLAKVHFDAEITGYAAYTNPQKLWSIGALVVLVLVIAIINFIALTTGHSVNRVKEMGLRKTLGTFKSALRFQLIAESFVFTLISGILGVAIAWFLLPSFNQLIEATIPLGFSLKSIAFIIGLTLIPGVICGLSQSTLLVSLKPIEALKGTNILSSRESWFNHGLIVLQFSISILLIIGTISIRSQMNYIQQRDLGFEKERLVEISTQSPENLTEAQLLHERFRAKALQNTSIVGVAASMNSFQEPWTQFAFAQVQGDDEELYFNLVDHTYAYALEIELVQGEMFGSGEGAATNLLVNEELVRHFGWENPLEQQLPGRNFDKPHRIIGVVKDFHFSSLHKEIEPLVLAVNAHTVTNGATGMSTYVWPPNLYQLVVRVGPGDIRESISFLEATWKEVNGSKPFTFKFIDDSLAQSYAEEARWQKLIDVASAFAIIIAWMGLLGLMRISVQKRLKEIGIRKALGSSVFGVTLSLSKKFLVLIGIANLLAWPFAWWGVNQWLESFSYRIEMNMLFLLSGGLAVAMVALLSVGFQARRAASVNPVECLRNE